MRDQLTGWWSEPLPERPDFGTRYPWRRVMAHLATNGYRRRVDRAREIVANLGDLTGWVACLSGGKDSTALALLLPPGTAAMSVRDGLCWPGEDAYLDTLCKVAQLSLSRVVVQEDLLAIAKATAGSLMGDHEDRAGPLSGHWFRAAEAARPLVGRLWGLRAEESRGRRFNRRVRGTTYARADGLQTCAPLSDWSALDVHAFLASRGVPPHPVYGCIDPGVDPMSLRHAWWVAGGAHACRGHYVWLRRWWPDLWDLAVEIDPGVADLS